MNFNRKYDHYLIVQPTFKLMKIMRELKLIVGWPRNWAQLTNGELHDILLRYQ